MEIVEFPTPTVGSARCGVQEAICRIAGERVEDPPDPFAGRQPDRESHGSARWFLANLAAMETLATAGVPADVAPTGWSALMRELRFATPPSLWADEDNWNRRVASMRELGQRRGVTAAAMAVAWKQQAPMAWAFIETLRERNTRLVEAAERLLAAAMEGAVHVYGRHEHSQEYGEIPRAVLVDPRTRWRNEPGSLLYEDRIRFADALVGRHGDFGDIRFSRAEIDRLAGKSRREPIIRLGKRAAAKATLQRMFPDQAPAGGKELEYAVIDEVKRRNGLDIRSARTVRHAVRELVDAGFWQNG